MAGMLGFPYFKETGERQPDGEASWILVSRGSYKIKEGLSNRKNCWAGCFRFKVLNLLDRIEEKVI